MRKNRADPVHTMHSCRVFSELGWDVTLLTPRVFRKEWNQPKTAIWSRVSCDRTIQMMIPTFMFGIHLTIRHAIGCLVNIRIQAEVRSIVEVCGPFEVIVQNRCIEHIPGRRNQLIDHPC